MTEYTFAFRDTLRDRRSGSPREISILMEHGYGSFSVGETPRPMSKYSQRAGDRMMLITLNRDLSQDSQSVAALLDNGYEVYRCEGREDESLFVDYEGRFWRRLELSTPSEVS